MSIAQQRSGINGGISKTLGAACHLVRRSVTAAKISNIDCRNGDIISSKNNRHVIAIDNNINVWRMTIAVC